MAQHLSNPWEDPSVGKGIHSDKLGRAGCCLNPCRPPENSWWRPPRCPLHWAGAGTWACTWGCSSDSWPLCCSFSGCSSSSWGTRWESRRCSPFALSDSLVLNRGFSVCCERWKDSAETLPGLRLVCAFADSCKKMTLKNYLFWTQVLTVAPIIIKAVHKLIHRNYCLFLWQLFFKIS